MANLMRSGIIGVAVVGAAAMMAAAGVRTTGVERGIEASVVEAAASSDYVIDAVHSAVIFRVKHNEAAYNYGRFNTMDGVVMYDAASGVTGIKVNVDTNSVDTANKNRDDHLRSPDFFNTKQFPRATFKSTSVKRSGDSSFEVAGEFTLNGVTKPITVTLEHTGNGKTRDGKDIAGFETTFSIVRSEYGMNKYLPGVGDEVRLMIGIEAVKQ
ncbi:MAG: YceI family protein [Phycisphaeraceae bacterium]|nr:YceI family protein [Phycisphaeraceae bacterium]MBX3367804.1 YceI family protein [Phycisphaeraceae bacterium]